MTGVGARFDSLRLSSPEMRRLGLALALSLAVHLFAWGGYAAGKEFGWWQRLHWPAWLYHLAIMKVVPQPTFDVPESPPPCRSTNVRQRLRPRPVPRSPLVP